MVKQRGREKIVVKQSEEGSTGTAVKQREGKDTVVKQRVVRGKRYSGKARGGGG